MAGVRIPPQLLLETNLKNCDFFCAVGVDLGWLEHALT